MTRQRHLMEPEKAVEERSDVLRRMYAAPSGPTLVKSEEDRCD